MTLLDGFANALWDARRDGRPIAPLTEAGSRLTVVDAYAIQRLNVDRAVSAGRRVVGHKVGLTSKAMQEMLGVDEPDFGVLLDDMVVEDGATVDPRTLLQPRIEAEIAFLLDADIRGPGVDVNDVLAATHSVMPALEIIDSRVRDWNIKLVDTVADNGSSAMAVMGKKVRLQRGTDLRTVGCVLERNGELVEHGAGAAVLGDPARCVAWLANTLAGHGERLRAGQIVLPGALHRAVTVDAGDTFTATFGGLGSVSVTFSGGPS